MLYSMTMTLVTTQSTASIVENVDSAIRIHRGKVVQSSDGILFVIFGSRFWTRIIGVWYGSEFSKFQLATRLRVKVVNSGDENHVVLYFVDNLGLGIPDQYSDTAYKKYFGKICDSIKKQLSAKELTTSSEQGLVSDVARKRDFNTDLSTQNYPTSAMEKRYPGYYWWCITGIFLFLPFGLIATVYASQSAAATHVGNHATAIAKERVAKRWLVATVLAWAVVGLYGLYCDFTGN